MSPTHRPVAVIGGGPAGLAAALTTAGEGLRTQLVERMTFGGELPNIATVRNLPGRPEISGTELADSLLDDIEAAGVEFVMGNVDALKHADDGWSVVVDGEPLEAAGVVIATGTDPAPLGLDSEEHLAGRGLATCAMCDGPLLRGRQVAVVGDGDIALVEAEILAGFAESVTVVAARPLALRPGHWGNDVLALPNVHLVAPASPVALVAEEVVTAIDVDLGDERRRLPVDAVFHAQRTHPAEGPTVGLRRAPDDAVWIDTSMCTSEPLVVAAGDCRAGSARLVAAALGDGVAAGRTLAHRLEGR